MYYFIADTHFGHGNIIEYQNRPFVDSQIMDDILIENWNEIVSEGDIVYHLGDIFLCNTKRQMEIMDRLNGDIILIKGNHDRQSNTKLIDRLGFKEVYDRLELEDRFILTHRPEFVDRGYVNIHGHTHSTRENDENHYCVSVEMVNYKPVSFKKIKEKYYNM